MCEAMTGMMKDQDPEPDSPALSVDVELQGTDGQELAALLTGQAQYIWRFLALPAAELSLVLADNAFSARLNETYRGKSGPTNVLSFPAQDFTVPVAAADFAALPEPRLLGDVVLALPVMQAEAQAQNKTVSDHARHLLTHGILHLIGYDHIAPEAAQIMENLEKNILAAQGVADPYRVTDATGAAHE